MKKIKNVFFKNPKTTLGGLVIGILTILKFYHVIETEEFVLWFGVLGTWLGFSAKDGGKKSNLEGPGGSTNPDPDGRPKP